MCPALQPSMCPASSQLVSYLRHQISLHPDGGPLAPGGGTVSAPSRFHPDLYGASCHLSLSALEATPLRVRRRAGVSQVAEDSAASLAARVHWRTAAGAAGRGANTGAHRRRLARGTAAGDNALRKPQRRVRARRPAQFDKACGSSSSHSSSPTQSPVPEPTLTLRQARTLAHPAALPAVSTG